MVQSERTSEGLTPRGDSWLLPLGDGLIVQLRVDFAFSLVFDNGLVIRVETAFSYANAGVIVEYDPDETASLAALLSMHGKTARDASVSKEGDLAIAFTDGSELRVPFNQHYEAFGISGPSGSGLELFALPGGGVSVFP